MSDLLERQLSALAGQLDVDIADRLVEDVLARLDRTSSSPVVRLERVARRRVRVVGAILAAAAAIVVLALPAPRHTIANWLGVGNTRIEAPTVSSSPTPATFPLSLQLGEPTSAADATARTGLPTFVAPALGAPSIFVVTPPNSGQIVVVYPASAALPPSPVGSVGALLATMPGTINEGLFQKVQGQGTTIESVAFTTASGHSVNAIWLSGAPHDYVFVDPAGYPVFDTLRLATNTLLWEDSGVTHRLEADVSRAQAVQIAATITAR